MKPQSEIQLVGGLLDLPILDKGGLYCGIVDDIEFEEAEGVPRVKAILVGPGAYRGRLPAWAFRLLGWIVGHRITHVPWEAIDEIASAAVLNVAADDLRLHRAENQARRLIPRGGAM